jgi:hypothetical protein
VIALLIARQPAGLLFVGVLIFSVVALFFATPLPWQRYYLLLDALWALAFGVGLSSVIHAVVKRFTTTRQPAG